MLEDDSLQLAIAVSDHNYQSVVTSAVCSVNISGISNIHCAVKMRALLCDPTLHLASNEARWDNMGKLLPLLLEQGGLPA